MALCLETEIKRTSPDRVVYAPGSADRSSGDTGNEHFLVFHGPSGGLMAVWTQSTYEGSGDQRIVFATGADEGRAWTRPRILAGPGEGQGTASWGFPLLSRSGRIFVIYNRYAGKHDLFAATCGAMAAVYSDDEGATWSAEQRIKMPRTCWDSRDPTIPANWIVWQKPLRFFDGPCFSGFTRWVSPEVTPPRPIDAWWANAAVVEFMRFENLDDDPEPRDLRISYHMTGEKALQVGLIGHPEVPVLQEPAIVPLPDGRLFCVMRTTVGHPFFSISTDRGDTWTRPEPLRQTDGSLPLLHPCSPCPIYEVAPGEYVFLYHNHDGHFGGWGPLDANSHRRPIYLMRGLFRPGAVQPIWFSEPQFFMDNGGVPILRPDLAMYSSLTATRDGVMLWYPDRKFFLLGREIRHDYLATLPVPTMENLIRAR
ncbi:MAG: sialidase family protein [Opitutaceae bacterium]